MAASLLCRFVYNACSLKSMVDSKMITSVYRLPYSKTTLVSANRFYGKSFRRMKPKPLKIMGLTLFGGISYCSLNFAVPILRESTGDLTEKSYLKEEERKLNFKSIKVSRYVPGPTKIEFKLTLFQYQTCPFCCKVRAFLDFHGIPYNIVEVNPVIRHQILFSEYKKVPILIIENFKNNNIMQLNDSSAIISMLETYFLDPKQKLDDIVKQYPTSTYKNESNKEVTEILNRYHVMFGEHDLMGRTFDDISEESKWRKWTDDVLVHTLSPNIYRTLPEAYNAFQYFSEVGEWKFQFSFFERYLVILVGSAAMYIVGKRLKSRYHLKDDVRQSLYDACETWLKTVGKKRKFMGGDQPNLADLAVYGVLSSIEGCQSFQDLLQNTKISSWYYSTKECIKQHTGSESICKYVKQLV